jgi:NAD(P)-dependent dehydrogenase (short-subunit alcohol dehydrogenase family)
MCNADFDLHDRIAVVTGAFGKLGGYFCEALLEANARVAAIDLAGTPVSAHCSLLMRRHGSRCQSYRADVTERQSLEQAHDAIRDQVGVPSVLVNNAGIDQPPGRLSKSFRLDDIPGDVCRDILEVNLLGLFQCT